MDTYRGHVKTPADAIILFEACRLGHLPRVQRRLSEKERQQITSGSVFVWDEREAGMRRWTDGKSWSASRVSGSFLTYREMEGKRSAFNSPPTNQNGGGGKGKDHDNDANGAEGPEAYRYKPDGLMKQSFSITTSQGKHLHLISYYACSHPSAATLMQPTNDRALRHIRPEKGMYPETTMHDAPAVTRSPMVNSPFPGSPYGTSPRHPQSQNYLRHPPPMQHPGYGWPPGPMDSPQLQQHSPYQQGRDQPMPGNQGPPQSWHNRPYEQARGPGPTAFDRVPPPMSNNAFDRAPPPMSHNAYGRAPPPMSNVALPPPPLPPPPPPSTYSSYPLPPSSSSSYAHASPYPQQTANHIPQSREGPPQYGGSSYNGQYTHPAPIPQSNIDPRLNEPPAALAPMQAYPQPRYELPPPPPPAPAPPATSASAPPPQSNGISVTSKTIPSIGSLINPTSPRPETSGRGELTNIKTAVLEQTSAPTAPPRGPQDTLGSKMGEKMGFGEDSRQLRQLDRATLRS